ncbi:MAG TPA: hypothetical protein VGV38_10935, partial [Pyrinomonadaceae bacterium]|nr:hypothetical protein [Pyrinomonadaceae bacterium]
MLLVLLLLAAPASAQWKSPTDGATPAGLSPGTPAGSYALSGMESVNLFNGSLSFRLPLLKVGGRGSAGFTVTLPIEQKWQVRTAGEAPPGGQTPASPSPNWWEGIEPGYGPGVLQGRRASYETGRAYETFGGGETSVLREVYLLTLTRLTFTSSDGTEYELRDRKTGGEPQSASWRPSTGNTDGFNRGRVF